MSLIKAFLKYHLIAPLLLEEFLLPVVRDPVIDGFLVCVVYFARYKHALKDNVGKIAKSFDHISPKKWRERPVDIMENIKASGIQLHEPAIQFGKGVSYFPFVASRRVGKYP